MLFLLTAGEHRYLTLQLLFHRHPIMLIHLFHATNGLLLRMRFGVQIPQKRDLIVCH